MERPTDDVRVMMVKLNISVRDAILQVVCYYETIQQYESLQQVAVSHTVTLAVLQ